MPDWLVRSLVQKSCGQVGVLPEFLIGDFEHNIELVAKIFEVFVKWNFVAKSLYLL